LYPLKKFLSQLEKEYHRHDLLKTDPLEFVHRYQDPWDQEVVAVLAAVLAYGNVKQIRKSVEDALRRMKELAPSPKDFVRSLTQASFQKRAYLEFSDFVHRFNRGEDLILLFGLIQGSWAKYGSLGSHFLTYLDPQDQQIGSALSRLVEDWRSQLKVNPDHTVHYLLTSPADGSCCKRWCMLLRWMGRKDKLDLGLWSQDSPLKKTFPKGRALQASQLIMPLDTHTGRISQYLGLTHRKSLNWKAAVEITDDLKSLDPQDPTRYDFALSRLGILDLCQKKYRKEICDQCQLLPACQFAHRSSNGHLPSTRP
jgi:uncharacterized protein (TIGR02757 family)